MGERQVDHELVIRVQQGDKKAFDLLVLKYQQKIANLISRYIRDSSEVLDVTQEAFVHAFVAFDRFDGRSQPFTWMYRIAVNRVKDYHRRQKFRSLFSLLNDNDNEEDAQAEPPGERNDEPIDAIVRKEFWQKVQTMLGQLSKMEQEVFLLRFLDELGIKEIAEVLHKSESTVKTHVRHILAKLHASSRHQAALVAIREGLIRPPEGNAA